MYRDPLIEADRKLREAYAAVAEHKRLLSARTELAAEVARAETLVADRAATLASEHRDVARFEGGVWAFLYGIAADRNARLTKEQQEAAAAQLKHDEAAALHQRLWAELNLLDTRIAALGSAERDLDLARKNKVAAMVASGAPEVAEIDALTKELGDADDDLKQLNESVDAGLRAVEILARLEDALASAYKSGTIDLFTSSMVASMEKRRKLDDAVGLASEAQAEMAHFRREASDVGIALEEEVASLAGHDRLLDVLFDNISSDLSVQGRIEDAQQTAWRTRNAMIDRLAHVRSRRDAVAARIKEATARLLQLIESQ